MLFGNLKIAVRMDLVSLLKKKGLLRFTSNSCHFLMDRGYYEKYVEEGAFLLTRSP